MTTESNPQPAPDPTPDPSVPAGTPPGAPPAQGAQPAGPPHAGPPQGGAPHAGPPQVGAPQVGAPQVGPQPGAPAPAGWSTQPLPPTPYPPRAATPSAPVGWVIAAMILFWPTGIPALLASHRAARAVGAGDEPVAVQEAATARRWSIVSVCVGAGLVVLSILVSIAWAIFAAIAVNRFHDESPWDDGPGWTQRSEPAFPFDGPAHPGAQGRGGPHG